MPLPTFPLPTLPSTNAWYLKTKAKLITTHSRQNINTQSPPASFKITAPSSSLTYDFNAARKLAVVVKIRTDTDPWKTAVRTVATMWNAYHLWDPLEEEADPETAPAIVMTWSRIRRSPTAEGTRRSERVRKMQLEAAPRRM